MSDRELPRINNYRDREWRPSDTHRSRVHERARNFDYDTNVNNWAPRPAPHDETFSEPRREDTDRNFLEPRDPYREGDSWFDRYERRNGDAHWSPNHHHRDHRESQTKTYHIDQPEAPRDRSPRWKSSDWSSTGPQAWQPRVHKSPERAWTTRTESARSTTYDRSWEPAPTWQNSRSATHKYKGNQKPTDDRKRWSQANRGRYQGRDNEQLSQLLFLVVWVTDAFVIL